MPPTDFRVHLAVSSEPLSTTELAPLHLEALAPFVGALRPLLESSGGVVAHLTRDERSVGVAVAAGVRASAFDRFREGRAPEVADALGGGTPSHWLVSGGVDPRWRGQGYGRLLCSVLLRHIGEVSESLDVVQVAAAVADRTARRNLAVLGARPAAGDVLVFSAAPRDLVGQARGSAA